MRNWAFGRERVLFGGFLLFVLAVASLSLFLNASQPGPVEEFIRKEMARRRIPGLVYAVIRDGMVQTMGAFGLANLETETPVRTSSVFEIASLTKPMTATAVMILVREGRVGLDDPITMHLKDVPASWGDIKVRHLLSHTAGFVEEAIAELDGSPLMDVTVRQQLDAIVRAPRLFKPGDGAQYSDPGYFLLGMIIEKTSGLKYDEFMERTIFQPLGMTATHVLDQERIVPGRVMPYAIREDRPDRLVRGRRDWQHALPSHFGVYSSIEDMAKWENGLARGTLLPRDVLETMWTPARLNDGRSALVIGSPYGFGWQISDLRGHRLVEHGGYTGTHQLRFPDDGLTIIVLSNLDKGSGNMPEMLARSIAGLVEPALRPPHLLPPQDDPDPRTTGVCRDCLAAIAAGQTPSSMTPAHLDFFRQQPEPVRKGMGMLFQEIKTFQYLGRDDVAGKKVERLGTPISAVLHYKSTSPRGSRYFSFYLSGDGRIAYMSSYPFRD